MEYLNKLQNTPMVQQVIDRLTKAMLDKELKPGDKIPTEIELAENFGVGRSTVREAIKILVYIGVLEIRRAEGTFVCNGFSENMIDPMIYGIILSTDDDYSSLMELREMTEVQILHLAILKNNPEKFKVLKEKLELFRTECLKDKPDTEKVFAIDNDFHDAVMAMGDNPLMEKINRIVRLLTYAMRKNSVTQMIESGRAVELYEAHEKICRTIEEKGGSDLYKTIQETYFMFPTQSESKEAQ